MCYILQVCDEPVAYMYDTPGKKFLVYNNVTILKAAMLVVNTTHVYCIIYMKMMFTCSSQRKEMLLFGRHDITCKPAINCKHL